MANPKEKKRVRALFVSDVHLGMRSICVRQLMAFLDAYQADTLYLVGDILDGWKLQKGWRWPPEYNRLAQAMLDKAVSGTKIVYLPGNHDEFLREYLGDNVTIRTYDTQENLDLDLQAGRVDSALASMSYWVPLFESDKGKGMAMVGPGMTGGPFGAGVGVGIRQKDQDLADMFTKAINEAIADGTVSKLAIKWFGFDASSKM